MSETKKLTFEEWKNKFGSGSLINDPIFDQNFKRSPEAQAVIDDNDMNAYKQYVSTLHGFKTKTYAEVMEETKDDINNTLSTFDKIQKKHSQEQIYSVMSNLKNIEEKNRCIRVRILDWMSDLFSHWSEVCHEKSVKIDSPCAIKLPKKEDNKAMPPYRLKKIK